MTITTPPAPLADGSDGRTPIVRSGPRPPYIQLWAEAIGGASVGIQVSGEVTPERLRRLRTEAPRALERLLREVQAGTEES